MMKFNYGTIHLKVYTFTKKLASPLATYFNIGIPTFSLIFSIVKMLKQNSENQEMHSVRGKTTGVLCQVSVFSDTPIFCLCRTISGTCVQFLTSVAFICWSSYGHLSTNS